MIRRFNTSRFNISGGFFGIWLCYLQNWCYNMYCHIIFSLWYSLVALATTDFGSFKCFKNSLKPAILIQLDCVAAVCCMCCLLYYIYHWVFLLWLIDWLIGDKDVCVGDVFWEQSDADSQRRVGVHEKSCSVERGCERCMPTDAVPCE